MTKSYKVWSEGFSCTGDRGTAQFHGEFQAESWDDACKMAFPNDTAGNLKLDRFGPGRHAFWACELFDNETDARRSFG